MFFVFFRSVKNAKSPFALHQERCDSGFGGGTPRGGVY